MATFTVHIKSQLMYTRRSKSLRFILSIICMFQIQIHLINRLC